MNNSSENHNKMLAGGLHVTAAASLNKTEHAYIPSPNEVAKRAYFNYLNPNSSPGSDVQNWIAAEAQLIKEHGSIKQ